MPYDEIKQWLLETSDFELAQTVFAGRTGGDRAVKVITVNGTLIPTDAYQGKVKK